MIEAVQRLKRNAETLFTETEIKALGEPNQVNIYQSEDEDMLIARAQHRVGLDGTGGGFKLIEMKPDQTIEGVKHLAVEQATGLSVLMSAKGELVNLKGRLGGIGENVGGAKAVGYVSPEIFRSRIRRNRTLAHYVITQADKELLGVGIDRHAPDMSTNSDDMDSMALALVAFHKGDEQQLAAFSGKSMEMDGLEIRDMATGQGLMFTLENHLKVLEKDPMKTTVAVQGGAGNVGYHFAKQAQEQLGVRIVGLSDHKRAIMAMGNEDLRLDDTVTFKNRMIEDYDRQRAQERESDDLLEMDVDVLVFAAAPDVITERKGNADRINAPIILQGANSPMDNVSIDYLLQEGKSIVSDIQGNAGGFVASNMEYSQGVRREKWERDLSMQTLRIVMDEAYFNVLEEANYNPYNLVDPAYTLALKNFQRTYSGVLVPTP
jgi:glutamate dehydrogenase/leucine dehydrogenase